MCISKKNVKKNPLCSSTHRFYIKNGKQVCHFFGNSKLKPIDYVAFFKLQEESSALTSSIYYSNVAQTKKKLLLHMIQMSKKTPHEASGQISLVKKTQ